jgi:hypothetical protein
MSEQPTLNRQQESFLKEEYKSLRAQIKQYTQDLVSFERWALLASGALWSYLVTNEAATRLPVFIFYGPAVVSTLLAFRSLGVYRSNVAASRYLAHLEATLQLPPGLGWHTPGSNTFRSWTIVWSGFIYWTLLCLINFAVAFYLFHRPLLTAGK